MRESNVQPNDLEAWVDYAHPARDSYGRKLVLKSDNFEIMVMSWLPGDFATIHDHGHTTWGAVQIFGPAEHAIFRAEDDRISTLKRWVVTPGDVIGVNHSLVHQMGNPTKDVHFLSLHVYGCEEPIDSITGDARIYNLENHTIERVDGGVFFALPKTQIERVEPGPRGDFPTRLRHMVELVRRLRRVTKANDSIDDREVESTLADTFSIDHHRQLLCCLEENTTQSGHQDNSIYWRALNCELTAAAELQREYAGEARDEDRFHRYAELYDALIGTPCMQRFMQRYLLFFRDTFDIDFSNLDIISLGCGTGLVEQFMIETMGADRHRLRGIDYSDAMVAVARQHIEAKQGDILGMDPKDGLWDMAYSGLNVFHYLPHTRLQEAIRRTAAIVRPGGYFVADFITPDHIRWYPNVTYSADKRIISLRSPTLVEDQGGMFQESSIINISFVGDRMEVSNAGSHRRFLPPMHRMRQYITEAFGQPPQFYDVDSLKLIPDSADSCPSTRYIAIAQKL